MSRDSLYQQLRGHLAYLNLTSAAEALPEALERAVKDKTGPTEFLEALLRIEVDATEARRLAGRMRFANFPAPWRLEDFDFAAQPGIDEALLRDLATCRYAESATNVLLIGPPGVGKTHLAIALGHAAVEAGLRTYYCTAADLAARCRRAAIEGRWANTMRFFKGPTVLIIDELGYLPMPGRATEVRGDLRGDRRRAGVQQQADGPCSRETGAGAHGPRRGHGLPAVSGRAPSGTARQCVGPTPSTPRPSAPTGRERPRPPPSTWPT